jgi:hypothetical protein
LVARGSEARAAGEARRAGTGWGARNGRAVSQPVVVMTVRMGMRMGMRMMMMMMMLMMVRKMTMTTLLDSQAGTYQDAH